MLAAVPLLSIIFFAPFAYLPALVQIRAQTVDSVLCCHRSVVRHWYRCKRQPTTAEARCVCRAAIIRPVGCLCIWLCGIAVAAAAPPLGGCDTVHCCLPKRYSEFALTACQAELAALNQHNCKQESTTAANAARICSLAVPAPCPEASAGVSGAAVVTAVALCIVRSRNAVALHTISHYDGSRISAVALHISGF